MSSLNLHLFIRIFSDVKNSSRLSCHRKYCRVNILKNVSICNTINRFQHYWFLFKYFTLIDMFESLMKKWKVSKKDLLVILLVFAITGFSTAYVSKAITGWVGFTETTHWTGKILLRLAILIFGYQAILLMVAFLLGQFPFFWQYEKKLLTRLRFLKKKRPVVREEKSKKLYDRSFRS